MIVSEHAQPSLPPILRLTPFLVSEPRSRRFSAFVYCGGRTLESIRGTRVIPEISSLNAAYTPAVTTTRMATRATAVQASILARRDRMRMTGPFQSVAFDLPIMRQAAG